MPLVRATHVAWGGDIVEEGGYGDWGLIGSTVGKFIYGFRQSDGRTSHLFFVDTAVDILPSNRSHYTAKAGVIMINLLKFEW